MTVTPDIQVSKDGTNWFSIFKTQEMMIFALLMQNVELNENIPMYYMRVAPKGEVKDYTPSMAVRIGPGKNNPNPTGA